VANPWIVKTPSGWFGPYADKPDAEAGLRRLRKEGDSLGFRLRGPATIIEAEPVLFRPIKSSTDRSANGPKGEN